MLLNRGGAAAPNITVSWENLNIPAGSECSVYDLWKHADLGKSTGSFTALAVPPTSAVMVVVQDCKK